MNVELSRFASLIPKKYHKILSLAQKAAVNNRVTLYPEDFDNLVNRVKKEVDGDVTGLTVRGVELVKGPKDLR